MTEAEILGIVLAAAVLLAIVLRRPVCVVQMQVAPEGMDPQMDLGGYPAFA